MHIVVKLFYIKAARKVASAALSSYVKGVFELSC